MMFEVHSGTRSTIRYRIMVRYEFLIRNRNRFLKSPNYGWLVINESYSYLANVFRWFRISLISLLIVSYYARVKCQVFPVSAFCWTSRRRVKRCRGAQWRIQNSVMGGALRFFWKIFLNGGAKPLFYSFFPKNFLFFQGIDLFLDVNWGGGPCTPWPPWIRHWP